MSATTKRSRVIGGVLAVPVLALCFGLSGCSDDTPADSETTQVVTPSKSPTSATPNDSPTSATPPSDEGEFVGDWTIERFENAGQTVTGESMRQQGRDMTFVVRADGTFTMAGTGDGAPEPVDGTWRSTSSTSGVFTIDGSGAEGTLDGDLLTVTSGDNVFVFARS